MLRIYDYEEGLAKARVKVKLTREDTTQRDYCEDVVATDRLKGDVQLCPAHPLHSGCLHISGPGRSTEFGSVKL